MSVLINEFEIVPEPSGGGGEAADRQPQQDSRSGSGVDAREVMTLVRRRERRRARVRAH